jgi:hypothetical protein
LLLREHPLLLRTPHYIEACLCNDELTDFNQIPQHPHLDNRVRLRQPGSQHHADPLQPDPCVLDSTDIVERYSWFGAFRSIVSNVGPNGAFLDPYGNLTDIGSWYLGGNATGKVALPTDTYSNTSCTAGNPCGKTSAATPHSPCLLPWLLAFLCTPLLYSLL